MACYRGNDRSCGMGRAGVNHEAMGSVTALLVSLAITAAATGTKIGHSAYTDKELERIAKRHNTTVQKLLEDIESYKTESQAAQKALELEEKGQRTQKILTGLAVVGAGLTAYSLVS